MWSGGRQRVVALPVGVVPTLAGQGLRWSAQAQAPVFLSQSPRWPWNSGGHQSYCRPGGLTNPETCRAPGGTGRCDPPGTGDWWQRVGEQG